MADKQKHINTQKRPSRPQHRQKHKTHNRENSSSKNGSTLQGFLDRIQVLSQTANACINSTLHRTEFNGKELLENSIRTKVRKITMENLKLARKYRSQQSRLMEELLATRIYLHDSELISFYIGKDELAKHNEELKAFIQLLEARLNLFQMYDNYTDKVIDNDKVEEPMALPEYDSELLESDEPQDDKPDILQNGENEKLEQPGANTEF